MDAANGAAYSLLPHVNRKLLAMPCSDLICLSFQLN